jgi:hypothetical protein
MSVKHASGVIMFADDTSVIVTDKHHDSFTQKKKFCPYLPESMVLYQSPSTKYHKNKCNKIYT